MESVWRVLKTKTGLNGRSSLALLLGSEPCVCACVCVCVEMLIFSDFLFTSFSLVYWLDHKANFVCTRLNHRYSTSGYVTSQVM